MSDEMGTTTTLLTESESRLAGTEQVKPTPGPWRVDPKASWRIVSGVDDTVATTGLQSNLGDQWDANACLISAAPEMLAALKALISDNESGMRFSDRIKMAADAIAKAEGRTP